MNLKSIKIQKKILIFVLLFLIFNTFIYSIFIFSQNFFYTKNNINNHCQSSSSSNNINNLLFEKKKEKKKEEEEEGVGKKMMMDEKKIEKGVDELKVIDRKNLKKVNIEKNEKESIGYIWPLPESVFYTKNGKKIIISKLKFSLFDEKEKKYIVSDEYVNESIERYLKIMKFNEENGEECYVHIRVKDLRMRNLQLGIDESYKLVISEKDILIESNNIFGLNFALETLCQLIVNGEIKDTPIYIEDKPNYKWRSVMVDTARHFITIETLKELIDAMSYNKFNTFHFHFMDSESFPIDIPEFPKIKEKCTYGGRYYSEQELKDFVDYCYKRSIRVIPEIEFPAHLYCLKRAYPEIITRECEQSNVEFSIINPVSKTTKGIYEAIIKKFKRIFIDDFIHLGGDEYKINCWKHNSDIKKYMKKNNLKDVEHLHFHFLEWLVEMYGEDKKAVHWEERCAYNTYIKKDKYNYCMVWMSYKNFKRFSGWGLNVINVFGWYFDRRNPFNTQSGYMGHFDLWRDMYKHDLHTRVESKNLNKIVGGGGCLWSEQANDQTISSLIWPKGLSVAEKLWSSKEVKFIGHGNKGENDKKKIKNYQKIEDRLIHHNCYNMIKRGVISGSISPDPCVQGDP